MSPPHQMGSLVPIAHEARMSVFFFVLSCEGLIIARPSYAADCVILNKCKVKVAPVLN
jgi:hypothetical protein